jgi:hypothetical protein
MWTKMGQIKYGDKYQQGTCHSPSPFPRQYPMSYPFKHAVHLKCPSSPLMSAGQSVGVLARVISI